MSDCKSEQFSYHCVDRVFDEEYEVTNSEDVKTPRLSPTLDELKKKVAFMFPNSRYFPYDYGRLDSHLPKKFLSEIACKPCPYNIERVYDECIPVKSRNLGNKSENHCSVEDSQIISPPVKTNNFLHLLENMLPCRPPNRQNYLSHTGGIIGNLTDLSFQTDPLVNPEALLSTLSPKCFEINKSTTDDSCLENDMDDLTSEYNSNNDFKSDLNINKLDTLVDGINDNYNSEPNQKLVIINSQTSRKNGDKSCSNHYISKKKLNRGEPHSILNLNSNLPKVSVPINQKLNNQKHVSKPNGIKLNSTDEIKQNTPIEQIKSTNVSLFLNNVTLPLADVYTDHKFSNINNNGDNLKDPKEIVPQSPLLSPFPEIHSTKLSNIFNNNQGSYSNQSSDPTSDRGLIPTNNSNELNIQSLENLNNKANDEDQEFTLVQSKKVRRIQQKQMKKSSHDSKLKQEGSKNRTLINSRSMSNYNCRSNDCPANLSHSSYHNRFTSATTNHHYQSQQLHNQRHYNQQYMSIKQENNVQSFNSKNDAKFKSNCLVQMDLSVTNQKEGPNLVPNSMTTTNISESNHRKQMVIDCKQVKGLCTSLNIVSPLSTSPSSSSFVLNCNNNVDGGLMKSTIKNDVLDSAKQHDELKQFFISTWNTFVNKQNVKVF